MAFVIATIFASVCLGVAIKGFMSLDDIADPTQLADAKGFAGFWAFLGVVGVACGAGSLWIARTQKEDQG